MVIWFKEGERE